MAPWPALTVLLGRPLEALKIKENGTGKKREVVRAHHDEERELRRLETTASRGGRQTPAAVFCALAIGSRAEGREGENEEGKTRARGLPPLEAETRGGRRTWARGEQLRRFFQPSERESRGWAVGGRGRS